MLVPVSAPPVEIPLHRLEIMLLPSAILVAGVTVRDVGMCSVSLVPSGTGSSSTSICEFGVDRGEPRRAPRLHDAEGRSSDRLRPEM